MTGGRFVDRRFVEHRDGVVLVHATWVSELAWFWDCTRCQCAFGPLTTRAVATAQADGHLDEVHIPWAAES